MLAYIRMPGWRAGPGRPGSNAGWRARPPCSRRVWRGGWLVRVAGSRPVRHAWRARLHARSQLIKAITSALVNLPLFRPGCDVGGRRRPVRKYICAACPSAPASTAARWCDYALVFCLRANRGPFSHCETLLHPSLWDRDHSRTFCVCCLCQLCQYLFSVHPTDWVLEWKCSTLKLCYGKVSVRE